VAIGRHGNFLHWGFAALSDDMTDEARDVFANAVVYIAGFAGLQVPEPASASLGILGLAVLMMRRRRS